MEFKQQLADVQQTTEKAMEDALSFLEIKDERLAEAMAYSLFNGGKRVRPFLVQAAAKAVSADMSDVPMVMSAVEMVHSYSLVHDDLPAMDDDDLRRGQPTCHIQFDEACAILAGDALLTAAFELLSIMPASLSAEQRLILVGLLGQGAGAGGMVAGQAIDLNSVGKAVGLEHLERMHGYKTGALIRVSALMGAHCGAPSADDIQALTNYANAMGLAFQIQDDILDVEGDTETLGKQQGADEALNKPTYPALLGLQGAKDKAKLLHKQALDALQTLPGDCSDLISLADYIIARDH